MKIQIRTRPDTETRAGLRKRAKVIADRIHICEVQARLRSDSRAVKSAKRKSKRGESHGR